MSIALPLKSHGTESSQDPNKVSLSPLEVLSGLPRLQQALHRVQSKIAPVWPLKDYVAVNPFLGMTNQDLLSAQRSLRMVSDVELLMPIEYYRDQFRNGMFSRTEIDAAVDEMVSDGVAGAENIDIRQIMAYLVATDTTKAVTPRRPIRTASELIDQMYGTDWYGTIREEISKHCSSHYDQGQSLWLCDWRDLSLYRAWRCTLQHDRSFEIHGIKGFRKFVDLLPNDADAAALYLLERLGVPDEIWEEVLLCHAMATNGWSAWTQYRNRVAEPCDQDSDDFWGLLAIRLAYETALANHVAVQFDWASVIRSHRAMAVSNASSNHEDLWRLTLLRASEIAYRQKLLAPIAKAIGSSRSHEPLLAESPDEVNVASVEVADTLRPLAQMVFCIDVRSERIRRHLETSSNSIQTHGFAGFFGLPLTFAPLGGAEPINQLPVLLQPKFTVYEGFDDVDAAKTARVASNRFFLRKLRQSWKVFSNSAVGCFGFIESTGWTYGLKLISRSIGPIDRGLLNRALGKSARNCPEGVAKCDHDRIGPCLHGLEEQGMSLAKQVDMAESMLRGIGLTEHQARLVVLCAHGSQTENNPLKASLDCGACGGHSGEMNARFAAKLLNQTAIREALAARGIPIARDVHFLPALHNTTTDDVTFLDVSALPADHRNDLQVLMQHVARASKLTRNERLDSLACTSERALMHRSIDWSEVRPEWGLAGNAAFIAAPRSLTRSQSLHGRAFLHSYDQRCDSEHQLLQQIMTAPMIVASWINLQYYASTVDPKHYGSGDKTIHNVVGHFGILSGNGGDLKTGLPWQSVHDGEKLQHQPLRLLVVLAASRTAIEHIVDRNPGVRDLVINGWLQVVAVEETAIHRYSARQTWEPVLFPSDNNRHSDSLTPSSVHSFADPTESVR